MKATIARVVAKRLFTTAGSIGLALALVGGAYALSGDVGTVPQPDASPSSEATTEAPVGTEGGTREESTRIHEGCAGAEGLEGDWNHGNYVSAIAKGRDSEATKAAAQSDCGKKAKNHGDEQSHGKGLGKSKNHDERDDHDEAGDDE